MIKLKKYKWLTYWSLFAIFIGLFIFVAISFEKKVWVGNLLQTIGTIAGIYLTIIIFLHSKEDSDKQFREHLEHLQNLNTKQIEALSENTNKQILSFEIKTTEIADKLADNSLLLAEILGGDLEKAITDTNDLAQKAEKEFIDLQNFKFFRTPEEKT